MNLFVRDNLMEVCTNREEYCRNIMEKERILLVLFKGFREDFTEKAVAFEMVLEGQESTR